MIWLYTSDWISCINIFTLSVCPFIIARNKAGVPTLFCAVIISMISFSGSMGNCLNSVISYWVWPVAIINNIADGCIGANGIRVVIPAKIATGTPSGNRGRIAIAQLRTYLSARGLSIGSWTDELIKREKAPCCPVGASDGNVGIVRVVNRHNII